MSTKKSYFTAVRISAIALFSALAGILHVLKFPLPFAFPEFLEFDFSDIPLLIGSFALGPVAGCIIVVVKILIKLVCLGTANAFVGELANLLIGIAFVLPAGLIYRRKRTWGGAIAAMLVASVCSIAVAMLANRFILIPYYVEIMFHGSWDPLLGMLSSLFPSVTQDSFYTFYLWVSVLPFNALRCLVASVVTVFVYKHISRAINRLDAKTGGTGKIQRREIVLICVFAGIVLLLVLFSLLRYFLWSK